MRIIHLVALAVAGLLAGLAVGLILSAPPEYQDSVAGGAVGGLLPLAVLYRRIWKGRGGWTWHHGLIYGMGGAIVGGTTVAVLTRPGSTTEALVTGSTVGLGLGLLTGACLALGSFASRSADR